MLRHARGTAAGCPCGDKPGPPGRSSGRRVEVAHVPRELLRASLQPADADHASERQPAEGAMDVSDDADAEFPDHAASGRQRAVCHRLQRQRLGHRRAFGSPDLAVSPKHARAVRRLLRPEQPRHGRAWRQALSRNRRRAPGGARYQDGRRHLGRRDWRMAPKDTR